MKNDSYMHYRKQSLRDSLGDMDTTDTATTEPQRKRRIHKKPHLPCPDPEQQGTVTVDEAARILGIARGSAFRAIEQGEIPHLKIGNRFLVPTAALRRMLDLDPTPTAS
jgi:excisionase family DNA binding protein